MLPKKKMLCPVCREDSELGYRRIYEPFRGYCKECKRTYVWEPNNETTVRSIKETSVPASCGCHRCGR